MPQVNSKDTRAAIKAFISHVESLEKAENPEENGFDAEYKLIQEAQARNRRENVFSMDIGKTENNLKKNRYKDILPYDKHRVTLSVVNGEQHSDYINASKLMGVKGTGGYIATQGPLALTVNDFWRMIWEYNVEIIFMACRIVELGKIKCKQYWNDVDKSEEFGDITVTTEAEEGIMSDCIRRNFRVTRGEEVRSVVQFHYSGWPDHGIPDDAGHIRDMIGIMRETRDNYQAPLLVHCSAGCGRSGAIITIDYVWTLLEEGEFDESFSLFDLICNFREQRMSIVQTADQYALVNKVLKTLCEEWLTRMASPPYENVDVDEDSPIDGHITDAIESMSEVHIYEGGHCVGKHVQVVSSEQSPTKEHKSPASPECKNKTPLPKHDSAFQYGGNTQDLADRGIYTSVMQVGYSDPKLDSPTSKKVQAPAPPSPLGSNPSAGLRGASQFPQGFQNATRFPVRQPPTSVAKQIQPTPSREALGEPIYSVINKNANQPKSNVPIYSMVNKASPKSPVSTYSLAKVPQKCEDLNGACSSPTLKTPVPPPKPLGTQMPIDDYGYSSVSTSFPFSPPPGSNMYSHLHQPSPQSSAESLTYDIIATNNSTGTNTIFGTTNESPLFSPYEDVSLPSVDSKPVTWSGSPAERNANTCASFLALRQGNLENIPGFNMRLPRVRGPVPQPQSWNRA